MGQPSPSRLASQQQRLYGTGRALVLALGRPADWDLVSRVWQGVQRDLNLPAPAIAVSGTDAFQLWFSLAAPVPADEGLAFLDGLCQRYWPEVAPTRVTRRAGPEVPVVPLCHEPTGNWSAFVARDLAPVFAETPWIDIPPGDDGQAELLSRLAPIAPADWAIALAELASCAPPAPGPLPTMPTTTTDPRQFLLRVMNDAAVPMALRIEAAKALLTAGTNR